MPCIAYEKKKFNELSLSLIYQAKDILQEYMDQGFVITLRQLYYQFVARDLLPASWADPATGSVNNMKSYKKLSDLVADGRMCGILDWRYLQDRTRNLVQNSHWGTPGEIIQSAARSYRRNLWEGQEYYVEVWVEKDALLSVIENTCRNWDVPYFACRGYTSLSEMWEAGQRLGELAQDGRKVRIIHLGDHDPSGIDMTRDVIERLQNFIMQDWARILMKEKKEREKIIETIGNGDAFTVDRIALNYDQILLHDPPPNPAKVTDPRAKSYIEEHGGTSWELDALPPDFMIAELEKAISGYVDEGQFEAMKSEQEEERSLLQDASKNWSAVVSLLRKKRV